MIPNVTRGGRMAGLLSYLTDTDPTHLRKGKLRNDHEDPHLVGGDDWLMAWYSNGQLSHDDAMAIARHLDRPRKRHGVDVLAAVSERQAVGRDDDGQRIFRNVKVRDKPAHVWHCSLSLPIEDGLLSDERWEEIAHQFVTRMGLVKGDQSDDDMAGSSRWTAIRHGISENGNDHIHVVVQMVQDDGVKVNIHNDYVRAQSVCRQLEREYGLTSLESARAGVGYDPGEREAAARRKAWARHRNQQEQAARRGQQLPDWDDLPVEDRQARIQEQLRRLKSPKDGLERTIRAAATASQTEAEFVRRVRQSGALISPHFVAGRNDVINGYRVAERPDDGGRPIWHGGKDLAADLSLPRLREQWPDSPQDALDAAGEWRAAKLGRPPVGRGREDLDRPWTPADQARLQQLANQAELLSPEQTEEWARLARYTSGVFAAWERRLTHQLDNQTDPDPQLDQLRSRLGRAADELGRSARLHRRAQRPNPARTRAVILTSAAAFLSIHGANRSGLVGQAVLLAELMRLTTAIARAAEVAGDARHASALLKLKTLQLEQPYAAAQPRITGATAPAPVDNLSPAAKAGTTSALPPELEQVQRQMRPQRGSGSRPARGTPQRERPARDRRHSPEAGRDSGREGQSR
ncbi:mobilization protein [Microlunatus endophyticus]|uniref:Mobilization protein n=1 Tax=Microlunatus endophyticus TaxID=1716077 RepID=A0A917SIX7_9ACTN|nr:hypothetical protein [Microlunatus endophyticus]GGL83434.1 mobilization protein [Microlunatus endophyticus]